MSNPSFHVRIEFIADTYPSREALQAAIDELTPGEILERGNDINVEIFDFKAVAK